MTSDIACLGVQANQEFASQSRPYELLRFASSQQLLVKGVEVRLVAPNDLRNHEQDRADAFAATTQRPSSEMLATIVGDRRQPGELGEALLDKVPISGISAMRRATVRPATPLIERNARSRATHIGSAAIASAILASRLRSMALVAAMIGSKDASASGSVTRRRWLVCSTLSSVSWRSRTTKAARRCCVAEAGGIGLMHLVWPYQATMPQSMWSVFSSTPMALAKLRTEQQLTMAAGKPAAQSWPKGCLS